MAAPSPPPEEWDRLFADRLESLDSEHRRRRRRLVERIDSTHVRILSSTGVPPTVPELPETTGETPVPLQAAETGRVCVDFSSNDYLGLAHHPKVVSAWKTATERWGVGNGASSLISGYGPAHQSAERVIAAWKGTSSAVLLPSGYQANVVAVQTLAAADPDTRFLIDKLAHASLLDAVRAAGAEFRVFPHNHLGKLRRLLGDHPPGQRQVVLTESIFSMDGDAADLAGLAEIKRQFPFFLLLDEAHASGVFGPGGSGLAAELNLREIVDAYVVTLSKAIGVVGGAICGSSGFIEAAVNLGRGLIFSTAVPAAVAAAAEAAIGVMADEPDRQRRVRSLAHRVRRELAAAGWQIPPGESPIVPVVIGAESAALAAAERLLEMGLLVPAIRPPAVARGASRLRITLSSEHTDEEIDQLIATVKGVKV